MGYKGLGSKLNIKNSDFTAEIIFSKQIGKLTPKAVDMFVKLTNHAIRRLPYSDPRDREDCVQFALLDLLLYWKNFNPEISNNAFAFFTQISYNGYAKGYKKIHKNSLCDTLSLNYVGAAEIYSL